MTADSLGEYYRSVWPAIAALPTDQGLSLPLFMALPDTFQASPLRLLIVGQETYSWYGLLGQDLGQDPVDRVLACYRQFNLGAGYRSPFWDATRKLCRLLGTPERPVCLAWSNLYPCDQRKRRPAEPLGRTLLDLRILPREVKTLNPHAVVFVTGPNYDVALLHHFPSAKVTAVDGPHARWISRVEHPDLPVAAYRTYHPAYLRRKKQGAVIETVAALIKASLALPAGLPPTS